jgi:hypothetical protein
MKIKILLLTCCLMSVYVLTATSATQEQIDASWNKGLAWIISNQNPNGDWSSPPGLQVQTTSEMVNLLGSVGLNATYTFLGALSWLSNAEPASVDGLARQLSALRLAGEDVLPLSTKLKAWRNFSQGWGAYAQFGSSLPDTPLAIIALMDCLGTDYSNSETMNAVAQFMTAQTPAPDHSWPFVGTVATGAPGGQRRGAIIPTAYAILALHKIITTPNRFTSLVINQTTYSLSTAVDNALAGLLLRRQSDHGFGDGTTSTLIETALAYQVLRTLLPNDPITMETLDRLLSLQSNEGDWEGNAFYTAMVISSLPLPSPLSDTDRDGIPDGVEPLLGLNPALADSRAIAGGPVSALAAVLPQGRSAPLSSVAPDNGIETSAPLLDGPVAAELFITGTSAEMEIVESIILSLFRKDGPLDIFYDDGGMPGETAGENHRAYLGVIGQTDEGRLDGKKVLIRFGTKGGSYNGVWPVALSIPVDRLRVDETCVDEDDDHRWSCPLVNTVSAVPDAGISEVSPELHVGQNVPIDHTEPDPGLLGNLDAEPLFKGQFAIAATRSLSESLAAPLATDDIRTILSGRIHSWADMGRGLPDKPVVLCRMPDGEQPAANALFLDIPCDPDATIARVSSPSAGYLVIEAGGPAGIAGCLNAAQAGGYLPLKNPPGAAYVAPDSFALGVLPASTRPGIADRFEYLPLVDGAGEALPEASMSTTFYMQWRDGQTGQATPLSEDQRSLLLTLRARLSSPEALIPYLGVTPFDPVDAADLPGCTEVTP